ncbi:hypothetical protein BGZ58_004923, partial [Dissophora ornata]
MATATETEPQSKEDIFDDAYMRIIYIPFQDKYEDKWEEDSYWAAVEELKVESKKIGYDDPFEVLGQNYKSFDDIRDRLKAGPPAFLRVGWKSSMVGTELDTVAVMAPLEHLNGPKYNGEERIVVLDFWAT